MSRLLLGILILAMLLVVAPGQSYADTVGINFCSGWTNPHVGDGVADGFDQWTDARAIDDWTAPEVETTGITLLNSNGQVVVTWKCDNIWWAGPEDTNENALYRAYLDDWDNADPDGYGVEVHITGLGAWLAQVGAASYQLRLYCNTDWDDTTFKPISVRDGAAIDSPIIESVTPTNMWDPGDGTTRANVDTSDTFTADTITITIPEHNTLPGDRGCLAAIKITSVGIAGFPAWDPDPEDDPDLTGAEVPTNKTMSWRTGEDPNDGNYGVGPDPRIAGHHIYLTTDKAALEATPPGDTSDPTIHRSYQTATYETYVPGVYNADTNPGGLDTDKVYYWRVDEQVEYGPGQDPNFWPSPIWTFQTTKLLPVFNPGGQPVHTAAFPDDKASLSVSVSSDTEEHYAWKKVVPDGGKDADVGTDSATLSFDPVQVSDEGQYYCVITNDAGPVTSNKAYLDVKRLVGRWQLNGNLTDSAGGRTAIIDPGDGYGGTPPADPNWADDGVEDLIGQDGQSYHFYDDVTENLQIPGTDIDLFNFHKRSGLTVSAWVKTTLTSHWGAAVSRQDKTGAAIGWILNTDGSVGVMTIRQANGDLGSSTNITDDQWHLLTGTYDPATGTAQIYIDGQLENSSTNTNAISDVAMPIVFGAETVAGDVALDGLLDDVRVYNYPLSSFDIAYLYTSFVQSAVICAEDLPIDYNGDCVQDLVDLNQFLRTWLECNQVPTCWDTPDHPLN
ncbi:MAG: hypothetical protein JW810_05975 [Sedimentisphaerales bacterium]|nr:hypothetical protein [Sedimentisphaerales bacterium]